MSDENKRKQDFYNVKKKTVELPLSYPTYPVPSLFDVFLSTIIHTKNSVLGIADASVEALRTFNARLVSSSLRKQGYSTEYLKDIFQTNASYHDEMSRLADVHRAQAYEKNMEYHMYMANQYRSSLENLRDADDEHKEEPVIDYDLLAKKVAEELKKNSTGQ